jgi:hypothetical protein
MCYAARGQNAAGASSELLLDDSVPMLQQLNMDSSVSAKIEPNPILSYPLHTRPCLLSGT